MSNATQLVLDFCLGSFAASLILITHNLWKIANELKRRNREP